MNQKEFQKEFREKQQQLQLKMLDANRNRAQTVSIGMSGSGMTEITMRGDDGTFLWNVYRPAQVIELIHQLASNVGPRIHIQPRKDFASYREWKDFASYREWKEVPEEEKTYLNGFSPFADQQIGCEKTELLPQETNKSMEKDNVATKKAVNKRASKRSRATTR